MAPAARTASGSPWQPKGSSVAVPKCSRMRSVASSRSKAPGAMSVVVPGRKKASWPLGTRVSAGASRSSSSGTCSSERWAVAYVDVVMSAYASPALSPSRMTATR